MASSTPFPSPQEGQAIHTRLLARDPTATRDLVAAFLDPLISWLSHHNRPPDPHHIEEAAEDAILALIRNPASYNPDRGPDLAAYLRMSARGDLLNILDRDANCPERVPWEVVELSGDERNNLGRDDDPSLPLEVQEAARAAAERVNPSVRDGLSEAEIRVLELMLQGERTTSVYAEAYGIGDLPIEAQRRVVKQVKDKLTKRLERAGGTSEPGS